jgi:hypothetical protein
MVWRYVHPKRLAQDDSCKTILTFLFPYNAGSFLTVFCSLSAVRSCVLI